MNVNLPDFLQGFEKRMQLVGVVDSIVNRRNKNMDIERLFQPGQLENILFSLLVYIMEKTLSEDEKCTLEHIASFLGEIFPAYGLYFSNDQVKAVADYLVKDILQNGGEVKYYPVIKYGAGMMPLRIRLIDDRLEETEQGYQITYLLTDQGYDFLFRTKEVDDEIRFTMEELKLRELIKRKNYKKAIQQSSSLIQMIRQKKKDIQQFVLRIRENIYEVDVGEYERLLNSTYDLLEEEYGMMDEIRQMVVLSEKRISEELGLRGGLDEEMGKALREIAQIRRNVNHALQEQRELILERHSFSEIYIQTIGDSFTHALEKRFDFDTEVLQRLEKFSEAQVPELWRLLNPLFLPNPERRMNLLSLYERQVRLKPGDEADPSGIEIGELVEDREQFRVEALNEANTALLEEIFSFAAVKRANFRLSQLMEKLREDGNLFQELMAENLLYTTLLKIYDLGRIDAAAWLNHQEEVIANASGEFDLGYALSRLAGKEHRLFGIDTITVVKEDDSVWESEISIGHGQMLTSFRVRMTDFVFEVKLG